MENTKREAKNAWDMAQKYDYYQNVSFSLDNGRADNPTLRAFLAEVYSLDYNSEDFPMKLWLVCNRHEIK